MELSFIHLSDIHFRKISGTNIDIDADLRNAILLDIQINAKQILKNIKGILVGGDIAYEGKEGEYDVARVFLKEITEKLDIDEKNVYCVPGNHDVNQSFIKSSTTIQKAQAEVEASRTIDEADSRLGEYIMDPASPELLFKSIEEYNNFAASYGCNVNSEKLVWIEEFPLDYNMKLKICGLNSCIISSHKDHEGTDPRKMIVGQLQIPSYEEDVVWVSLCHHPIEFWKFKEEIQTKLDKRVDIQLYGHKHEQVIDASHERLVINAGAAQPTRGQDWEPRYNWITFECVCEKGQRIVKVKTFPRSLSKDRDRFICDKENCTETNNFFLYEIDIDKKRDRNLKDDTVRDLKLSFGQNHRQTILKGQEKEIVYKFFELSYIQQTDILNELDLLRNDYAGKQYVHVIKQIMQEASEKACLQQMEVLIKESLC